MKCIDCDSRVGIKPVVLKDGAVLFVCQICFNRNWRAWLHKEGCVCELCVEHREIVGSEAGGRMVETPEGIGARKFSMLRQESLDSNKKVSLMQGSTELAALTPAGEAVFRLLVTSPQLWDAANAFILKAAGEAFVETFPEFQTLKAMVAKAVGKDSWKEVSQS